MMMLQATSLKVDLSRAPAAREVTMSCRVTRDWNQLTEAVCLPYVQSAIIKGIAVSDSEHGEKRRNRIVC